MLAFVVALLLSFTCQPSRRNGYLCCSTPRAQAQTPFLCPGVGQTPVLTNQNTNQICYQGGSRSTCPQDSLCYVATNSQGMLICCRSAPAVTPICPNNGIPQSPLTGNSYVACSDNSNTCNFGFTCVNAANDVSIRMCCSSNSAQNPICPNQQTLYLEFGRPRYCVASQPSACPSGYSCELAVGTAGSFVCCTLPLAPTCPAQFAPSIDVNGNMIFCSQSVQAGCPSGSSCLQSSNSDRIFLCCRPDIAPRVCSGNQIALRTPQNTLVTCSGPGGTCSRLGYTCQYCSVCTPQQYICCGQPVQNAFCADGRETFTQTSDQTYTCNALAFPTGCPINYDCALSTQQGVFVCCKQNSVTVTPIQQCPNGWNPFRNQVTGAIQSCSGTLDTTCPSGYSCTPSSSLGVFQCCRLASTLTCARGTTYISNNQPRLCSVSLPNQCPRGYSCQQSTNPTVTICCSSALLDENVLCPDRSQPSMIGSLPLSCPIENSQGGCPQNFICRRSNKATLVCCSLFPPITRYSPTQLMAQCPNGVRVGTSKLFCETSSDCPSETECLQAINMKDVLLCCATAVPADTRCRARRTQLLDGQPVSCTQGNSCENGYECSSNTSNGRSVCCEELSTANSVCPDSRIPYIVAKTETIFYCDATAFTCPQDFQCLKSSNESYRHVCCSPTPRCLGISESSPTRCQSSEDCRPGEACTESSINGVYVCCTSHAFPISKDSDWDVIEGR